MRLYISLLLKQYKKIYQTNQLTLMSFDVKVWNNNERIKYISNRMLVYYTLLKLTSETHI